MNIRPTDARPAAITSSPEVETKSQTPADAPSTPALVEPELRSAVRPATAGDVPPVAVGSEGFAVAARSVDPKAFDPSKVDAIADELVAFDKKIDLRIAEHADADPARQAAIRDELASDWTHVGELGLRLQGFKDTPVTHDPKILGPAIDFAQRKVNALAKAVNKRDGELGAWQAELSRLLSWIEPAGSPTPPPGSPTADQAAQARVLISQMGARVAARAVADAQLMVNVESYPLALPLNKQRAEAALAAAIADFEAQKKNLEAAQAKLPQGSASGFMERPLLPTPSKSTDAQYRIAQQILGREKDYADQAAKIDGLKKHLASLKDPNGADATEYRTYKDWIAREEAGLITISRMLNTHKAELFASNDTDILRTNDNGPRNLMLRMVAKLSTRISGQLG